MKKVVIFLIIISFVTGFFIGRISKKPIEFQINYPIYYTITSSLNSFDGFTGDQIDSVLKGTAFYGLGKYFSFYSWQNNINSIYLTAHAILEASEPGTNRTQLSYIARTKNNLYGLGAFDESPYYSASYFKNYQECIQFCSAFIAKEYLDKNGKYYISPDLQGMNTHYATSKTWCQNIVNIMNELRYKIGNSNINEAIAENWYIQNFNQINLPLTKGQVIRDIARLYSIKENAGQWAMENGIIDLRGQWWNEIITRKELIDIFRKAFHSQYKLRNYKFILQILDTFESYTNYYCQAIYKYFKYQQEVLNGLK